MVQTVLVRSTQGAMDGIGCWAVGNGGIGTIANQQGIESTFKWEREDISHGKQVNFDWSAVCVILTRN
jgi:hypothetical protein